MVNPRPFLIGAGRIVFLTGKGWLYGRSNYLKQKEGRP
jgi:hypothetical protein